MLTKTEKKQVDQLIEKGVSLSDIKKKLGKGDRSRVVENYIKSTVEHEWDSAKEDAVRNLVSGGMTIDQANNIVNDVMSKIDLTNSVPEANTILQSINKTNLTTFKTHTESGAKNCGFVAMTGSSSGAGDSIRHQLQDNRHAKSAIFKPKG